MYSDLFKKLANQIEDTRIEIYSSIFNSIKIERCSGTY